MTTAVEVKREAERIGFVACGVTSLDANQHGEVFDRWIAAGYAGTMRYLHRQARKRKNPSTITPSAIRAVVVLDNYAPARDDEPADDPAFKVAAYARGMDYHIVTLGRLHILAERLKARGAQVAHAWVDDGPTPDRELAARAGLGWIGRNGMLIHPRQGSYTFIGSVFTDLALDIDQPMQHDLCGSCTRCLDACPTGALLSDRTVDATRCISYLTIEYKGELPESLTPHLDGWAFGCDICNDVCPWNTKFAVPTTVEEFVDRNAIDARDPEFFEQMDEVEFHRRFADTPLARPGLERMRRNVRAARAERAPA